LGFVIPLSSKNRIDDGITGIRLAIIFTGRPFVTRPASSYALTEPNLATQAVSLNGTYTVNSSGRATASVDTLSPNLVFYLISGTDGYIVQADSATQIAGSFSMQQ